MTTTTHALDPMVADGKRNRLAFMEATLDNARKCPPGVDPRFHRLDLRGWKRERDRLREELGMSPAKDALPPGRGAGKRRS